MSAYAWPETTPYFSCSRAWSTVSRSLACPGRVQDADAGGVVDELEQVAVAGDHLDGARRTAAGRPASRATRVPMTSSASKPGAPGRASPSASSTSTMTGTCGSRPAGTSSATLRSSAASRPPGAPCRTGSRRPGTPAASRRPSRRRAGPDGGRRAAALIMSSRPRTAFTGVPSGRLAPSPARRRTPGSTGRRCRAGGGSRSSAPWGDASGRGPTHGSVAPAAGSRPELGQHDGQLVQQLAREVAGRPDARGRAGPPRRRAGGCPSTRPAGGRRRGPAARTGRRP